MTIRSPRAIVLLLVAGSVTGPAHAAYLSDFLGVSSGDAAMTANPPYTSGLVHAGSIFGIGADTPGAFNTGPFFVNTVFWNKGIGMHPRPSGADALSQLTFHLDEIATYEGVVRFTEFRAWVGINDSSAGGTAGSACFSYRLDGGPIHPLACRTGTNPASEVNIDVSEAHTLTLITDPNGDNADQDHAVWAGAQLIPRHTDRRAFQTGPDTAAKPIDPNLTLQQQIDAVNAFQLPSDDWAGVHHTTNGTGVPFRCSCAGVACCTADATGGACTDGCAPSVADPLGQPYVGVGPIVLLREQNCSALDAGCAIDQVTWNNCQSAWYRLTFELPGCFFEPYLRAVIHADDQAVAFLNGHRVSGAMNNPCNPVSLCPSDPCLSTTNSAHDWGFDKNFPGDHPSASPRRILTWPTLDPFSTAIPQYFRAGTNEIIIGTVGDASFFEPTGIQVHAEVFFRTDCDDGDPCTDDVCGVGSCTHPDAANGAPCGDPTVRPCDLADACQSGMCFRNLQPPGTACPDDGQVCTDDVCNGAGVCVHPDRSGPCNDGEPCTENDMCIDGVCRGDNIPDCCENEGECTPASECAERCCVDARMMLVPSPAGTPCGDPAFGPCDDPDTCDGAGSCQPNYAPSDRICHPKEGPCDPEEQCPGDGPTCPPNEFAPPGTPCPDDGNPCTDDECDGTSACTHPPNCDPCDDGDVCTENDRCRGGRCTGDLIATCCRLDEKCDDGVYCNGMEFCNEVNECEAGVPPCADMPGSVCLERRHCCVYRGDFTCDGLITLEDWADFATCISGPESPPSADDCAPADLDADGDSDLADIAVLLLRFDVAE